MAFSSEIYELIYQIENICILGCNYEMAKIDDETIGISGIDYPNGIIYLLSIEEKAICSKLVLDEFYSTTIITTVAGNATY